MSITADVMWNDLLAQAKAWMAGGLVPNSPNKKSYMTGYSGPNRGNEDINTADFDILLAKWKAFGDTKPTGNIGGVEKLLMYFGAAKSQSGGDNGVMDFKCGIHDDSRTFVHHIIVK